MPKAPQPCESDSDCLESEACFMAVCQDPCEFTNACAETARCQAKMHRPICTCPMGTEGNPAVKCFKSQPCKILKKNLHNDNKIYKPVRLYKQMYI